MGTLFGKLYILLVTIVPFIFIPNLYEAFEVPKFTVIYIFAVLAVGLWAWQSFENKKFNFKRTILDTPLIIFLVFQLISSIFSIDIITSVFGYYTRYYGGLTSLIALSLIYWAGVSNLTKKDAKNLITTLIVVGGVLSFWAVLEHFGISPSCIFINSTIKSDCWSQNVMERPFATVGQPNWLAAFLAMVAPLTWKNNRPIYLLLGLLIFAAILYTKSRSGLIGFGVAFLAFWAYEFIQRKTKIDKKLLMLFAGAHLILFITINPLAIHTPENPDPTVTSSANIRTLVWQGALDTWRNNSLVGTGPETFAYSYYQYRPVEHNLTSEWNFVYSKAHNEYLNYLANTGFIGSLGYLLFTIYSIKVLSKHKELLAGYIALLVSNLFSFTVSTTALLTFLYPTIAISLQNKELIKNNKLSISPFSIVIITASVLLIYRIIMFVSSPLPIADEDIKRNKDLAITHLAVTPDKGIQLLSSIEPKAPTDPMIPYFKALGYINLGDEENAKENLEKALQLKPNYELAQQAYKLFNTKN